MTQTQLELENKLKIIEETLDATNLAHSEELYSNINAVKAQLNEIDNYKTEGLILRSGCQWYEKGEKKQ